MTTTGRFSKRTMTTAMRRVADGLGRPAHDARLLRLTNNAVFALPTTSVVIRIGRTHRLQDRVYKVVRLARWFAEIDAPTIRLVPDIDQPIPVGDLLATVWAYVPPTPPTPTASDLGRVLREFHGLGAPSFPLPRWDPVGDARARLADSVGLADSDREFLLDWCDRLESEVARLNDKSPRHLIHGDAHASNLLRESTGRVVFCDFDATCLGPWQVDLAAVAVGEARFDRKGAHATLADGYGYDVTTDANWPLLRDARELKMVAAAIPLLDSGPPAVAAEFTARLNSIRNGDHRATWRSFAEIGP